MLGSKTVQIITVGDMGNNNGSQHVVLVIISFLCFFSFIKVIHSLNLTMLPCLSPLGIHLLMKQSNGFFFFSFTVVVLFPSIWSFHFLSISDFPTCACPYISLSYTSVLPFS